MKSIEEWRLGAFGESGGAWWSLRNSLLAKDPSSRCGFILLCYAKYCFYHPVSIPWLIFAIAEALLGIYTIIHFHALLQSFEVLCVAAHP